MIPRILAVLLTVCPVASLALELGFDSSLSVAKSSFNSKIAQRDNPGVAGTFGIFDFALFGQQQGDLVDGGFLAEVETQRLINSPDDNTVDNETLTRFYGGASIATPLRSLNWYVGDVLSGVLAEDQLQSLDSSGNRQLNLFVTGPEISTRLGVRKTLDLSLYYVHQSDDTENELDSIYNLSAEFDSELSAGRNWGLRLSDVYVEKPDSALSSADYNRASGAVFIRRERGVTTLDAELGMTQYESNGEGSSGLRLGLDWSRSLSETTSLTLRLSHDQTDRTLDTVQNLTSGQSAREEKNGVSANTAAIMDYEYRNGANAFNLQFSAVDAEYLLITEQSGFTTRNSALRDNRWYTASAGFKRGLTAKLGFLLDVNLQRQKGLNLPDENDSLSVSASFRYALNNRWSWLLGTRYLANKGISTTLNEADGTIAEQRQIDETENRVFLGLRWAPPTRASRRASGVVRSLRL